MQSLLDLQPGENVRAILPVRDLEEEGKFIFFATQKGTVKKTLLKDFSKRHGAGHHRHRIDKDDELVEASITDGSQIVFLATHLAWPSASTKTTCAAWAGRPTACAASTWPRTIT